MPKGWVPAAGFHPGPQSAGGKRRQVQASRGRSSHAPATRLRVVPDIASVFRRQTDLMELVGRMAIIDDEQPAVFASYLVRLTVDTTRCLPRFLNYFMNWPATQDEIKKLASRAVGQANINASKLRTVLFPLPPTIDEQNNVVVDYYEGHGQGFDHYCEWLDARGFHGIDWMPHDAKRSARLERPAPGPGSRRSSRSAASPRWPPSSH